MQQKAESFISEGDYFEMEETGEIKHEYYQGEIFAMAGESERHNLIVFGEHRICELSLQEVYDKIEDI